MPATKRLWPRRREPAANSEYSFESDRQIFNRFHDPQKTNLSDSEIADIFLWLIRSSFPEILNFSMTVIENGGLGTSPLWDYVWCRPTGCHLLREKSLLRNSIISIIFQLIFNQSNLLSNRGDTNKTGNVTCILHLKWSSQSRPMSDLVRNHRSKTPDQPSLFLNLNLW